MRDDTAKYVAKHIPEALVVHGDGVVERIPLNEIKPDGDTYRTVIWKGKHFRMEASYDFSNPNTTIVLLEGLYNDPNETRRTVDRAHKLDGRAR